MEFLYTILGALLALAGGVITQHLQQHYAQLRRENDLLFECNRALLEIGGVRSQIDRIDPSDGAVETLARKYTLRHELISLHERLAQSALQMKSKKNRSIALRISKYALEDHLQTEESRETVLREVQKAINRELIDKYNEEMERDPHSL